jgi:hypothetical protein
MESFFLCVVCREWQRIFMGADGAGLRRAASNDDKVGGWDGTARREGGSLGKKLTKGEIGRKGVEGG